LLPAGDFLPVFKLMIFKKSGVALKFETAGFKDRLLNKKENKSDFFNFETL